jgi:hypothetical protein
MSQGYEFSMQLSSGGTTGEYVECMFSPVHVFENCPLSVNSIFESFFSFLNFAFGFGTGLPGAACFLVGIWLLISRITGGTAGRQAALSTKSFSIEFQIAMYMPSSAGV